jgi:excinuclease ABC subunit C
MRQAPGAVLAKVPHLPESPGVYLWKDAEGKVLYIGKAKRLRSRVRSYFTADHTGSVKTQALLRLIEDVDTIVVPDEAHALILENTLIKEHRPRFNIALRDDKSYPYIKVTVAEPFRGSSSRGGGSMTARATSGHTRTLAHATRAERREPDLHCPLVPLRPA